MTLCYLGFGSNLKNPHRQLHQALKHIRHLPKTALLKISHFYASKPWGRGAQPPFTNLVALINTHLSPDQLLRAIQAIEKKQKRVRKIFWGPRTIDIDILLYGTLHINRATLTIPHPWMLQRDFVLQPLLEIAPHVRLPNGQAIAHIK